MQFIRKKYPYVIFIIFCLIFLCNIFSFFHPFFGKLGTIFWFISYLFLAVFAFKALIFLFSGIKTRKSIFTLFMVMVWIFVVFVNLTSNKNLSGETTIEIRCAILNYSNSKDFSFNQTCLFGYPSRQYFLPTLPTLIGGSSQFNLNLGGALYFLFGIIIFSSGVIRFLKKGLRGDLITAILLTFIFHFYYVNHFLTYFEQSIFPFSFALITCGLLLHFIKTKSNESLFLTSLLSFYLIYSYTPSLFFYFLLLLIFLYLIVSTKIAKSQKIYLLVICVFSFVSFILSLRIRSDINIYMGKRDYFDLLLDLKLTLSHLFLQNQGNPIISPYLNFIFLLIVFFSYSYLFDGKFLAASLWILSVIVFSALSQGYIYYGIDFRLHRASVIFPVFLSMLAILSGSILSRLKLKTYIVEFFLFVVFIFYLFTGLLFFNKYMTSKGINYHLETINFLKEKGLIRWNKKIKFFIDPETQPSYWSFYDYAQYFAPNGVISRITPPDCQVEIEKDADNIFLLGTQNPCLNKIPFDKLKLLEDNGIIKIYIYEK